MYDSYRLGIPENVELTYTPAALGSRFLAAAIDTIIIGVLSLVVLIIGGIAAAVAGSFSEAGGWLIFGIVTIALFVIFFGYYIFFESLWNGQSPGKRALGLRVMLDDGLPLTFSASAIRNLVRLIDFLPGSYAFGVVAMFLNRRWKRLGDMAAGTVVILDQAPAPPPELVIPRADELRAAAPEPRERLTDTEYEIVRAYLLRYPLMDPAARERLGARVVALAERRTGIPSAGSDVLTFLATVIATHSRQPAAPEPPRAF